MPSSITVDVNTQVLAALKTWTGSMMANVTSDSVLLPTVMVQISGGVKKVARAVFDSGSQWPYILKRTAQEMKYATHRLQKELSFIRY